MTFDRVKKPRLQSSTRDPDDIFTQIQAQSLEADPMLMRERVTFVQPLNEGVDPKLLSIQDEALTGPSIDAIKEDRFAMNIDGFPTEFVDILEGLKELYIRWVSPVSHHLIEPFVSRLSPGLHLSFTPINEINYDPSKLCTYLSSFQPLDCVSPTAFTTKMQPESPNAPAFSFYQQVETPKLFQKFAVEEACGKSDTKCLARLMELNRAASIDVSYHVDEPEAKRFKVSALWGQLQRDVEVAQINMGVVGRVEAGVLSHDIPTNLKSHELGLSGVLTVLGESKQPSPTLFSVSARHRAAQGSFTSGFLSPTGLHPELQLTFGSLQRPGEDGTCQLYSYLTLPKTIFADKYQLGDDLFLASKNLTALRSTTLPVDLEAPAYTTDVWGSNVLLQVTYKQDISAFQVPLHLRYLEPSSTGYQNTEVPYPVVFWACEAAADVKLSDNPFDRTKLGYDSFFSEQTVFWHVTPHPEAPAARLMNEVNVPVLNKGSASWVELGTGIAIMLGFGWVLLVIARVLMGSASSAKQNTKQGTKKKQ